MMRNKAGRRAFPALFYAIFVLDPSASHLAYHGVASLHSFDADVGQVKGEATVEGASLLKSARGRVELDVKSIDTHIGKRNDEMFKLLEPGRFPKMVFTLKLAEPVANVTDDGRVIEDLPGGETKCALKGELTVRGKSVPVEGRGHCRDEGPKGWIVDGEAPVDMTAYGIEPPHVAFITMDKVVRVTYHLVFKPVR